MADGSAEREQSRGLVVLGLNGVEGEAVSYKGNGM
jgi:hypothetical protein